MALITADLNDREQRIRSVQPVGAEFPVCISYSSRVYRGGRFVRLALPTADAAHRRHQVATRRDGSVIQRLTALRMKNAGLFSPSGLFACAHSWP
jgi:hypothetical protein